MKKHDKITAKDYTNTAKKTTTSLKSTSSEKPHLKTLLKHKGIYDLYVKTGEIINLHPHVKDEIVEAYKVEFPFYTYQKNCAACMAEMLVTVYRWYESQI